MSWWRISEGGCCRSRTLVRVKNPGAIIIGGTHPRKVLLLFDRLIRIFLHVDEASSRLHVGRLSGDVQVDASVGLVLAEGLRVREVPLANPANAQCDDVGHISPSSSAVVAGAGVDAGVVPDHLVDVGQDVHRDVVCVLVMMLLEMAWRILETVSAHSGTQGRQLAVVRGRRLGHDDVGRARLQRRGQGDRRLGHWSRG